MTHVSTLLPDEKNKTEKLKEPGKRWRGKSVVVKRFYGLDTLRTWEVGEFRWGTAVYPTKDIAESKAAEEIAKLAPDHALRNGLMKYLGAFETE